MQAGEELFIEPGNSLTITPYMFHTFGAKKGYGDLIAGEVSAINDDVSDNFFAQKVDRYILIDEDEPARYLLYNEYDEIFSDD